MAQSVIVLPPDSTGKSLATDTRGDGAHMQDIVLYSASGTPLNVDVVGTKNALDVNLAGSSGGVAQVSQVLTTNTVPSTPNTASTTSAVVSAVGSSGNATIVLTGGSFTGSYTINFEASDDGGTTWIPIMCVREDIALSSTTDVITGSAGAGPTHAWTTALPGFTHVRARASVVPGTITTGITARISAGPFLVEPTPATQSTPLDGNKPTYTATIRNFSNALATDIFTVTGSATRVVRVLKVNVSVTATTAGLIDVAIIRRSTVDTGGTAGTAPTVGPNDSNDAAATAVAATFSAAPTALGTQAAIPEAYRLGASTTAAVGFIWQAQRPSKAIVLRGAAAQLAINVGAAVTGGVWDISVEWTEEAL